MSATIPFNRLILRAVLRDVNPMVARLISVSDETELSDLHDVFQRVMGWSGDLGYCFRIHGKEFNSLRGRTRSKPLREFHCSGTPFVRGGTPLSPSITAIRMSSTPRFRSSFMTCAHLHRVLIKQKALDLTHCHPARIHRDDVLIEAFKALLSFSDQQGLKAPTLTL
jgi:hypothetical protein